MKPVAAADNILVFDKGRIVQQGTHETLKNTDGIYKSFIEHRRRALEWTV